MYGSKLPEPADVLLLIEVADTTYAEDAEIMLAAYASAGIPFFVIARIRARWIELYTDPDPAEGTYRCWAFNEVGSTVAILCVEISVADVYGFLPA